METGRLELGPQEVEQHQEIGDLIAGQLLCKLQEPIVVAAIRTFLMTELPAHNVTVILQMQVGTGMGGTARRIEVTKVLGRPGHIRRIG